MSSGATPTRPQLRLMSHYSADTPLWTNAGNLLDVTALGLRQHLVESLITWQRHFDQHSRYDREPPWDSPVSADWYAQEGRRLLDRLSRALPDVEVVLNLWSIQG